MKPVRVLSIFGTRPEAVKMAPVVRVLSETLGIESKVCVTAQHREMLDQVLKLFKIQPDFDLNLMQPDQSLAALNAEILTHLDPLLTAEHPDWILVQGDTTTVMAASLAAFYHNIRVGHVEAGLRTGDKHQPFPEEINRCITSVIADLHFAPTETNRQNLLREGIEDWRIKITGNTVIDALQQISSSQIPQAMADLFEKWEIGAGKRRLIVVTAHRRENLGEPILHICQALKQLSSRYGDTIKIVYPVHLNPNIQEPVNRTLQGIDNIELLSPLEYLSMVHLMKASSLVLTDSGGIQEEATGLGKPTLVLREKTERPEGIQAGVLQLVGTDPERIVTESCRLLDDTVEYQKMAHASNPFGDGRAAERIVQELLRFPADRS